MEWLAVNKSSPRKMALEDGLFQERENQRAKDSGERNIKNWKLQEGEEMQRKLKNRDEHVMKQKHI